MSVNPPLVSCIMPTRDRPKFVAKAIEYFLRQTYPNKELLIVDDGTERYNSLLESSCRYIQRPRFQTLGEKRNECVRLAHGNLIAIFDDDDFYAPERLARQVAVMRENHAEVCGIEAPIFYDLLTGDSFQYQYRGLGRYLYSATLMFTRDYWARLPFPNLQMGASTPFVCRPGRLDHAAFMSSDWYTGISHSKNNSPKMFKAPEYTRWEGDIEARLGTDWFFYQKLPSSSISLSLRGC